MNQPQVYMCSYILWLNIFSQPRDYIVSVPCSAYREYGLRTRISYKHSGFLRVSGRKINVCYEHKQRRQWHPTPVLLPGKSHGWRSLVGCSPWGCQSRTRLSDFPFTFHFHALEKEMATHSSVLAWRIPGTGEPVGLLSTGSHRVGHD